MSAPDEVAIVHVMNRVVRRCFLLGTNPVTGKNYDHRKQWIEDELKRLAGALNIDLLGFSIQSVRPWPRRSGKATTRRRIEAEREKATSENDDVNKVFHLHT